VLVVLQSLEFFPSH